MTNKTVGLMATFAQRTFVSGLFALLLTIVSFSLAIPVFTVAVSATTGWGINSPWVLAIFVTSSLGLVSAGAAIYLSAQTRSLLLKVSVMSLAGLASIPHAFVLAIGLFVGVISFFAPEETQVSSLHKAVMSSNIQKARNILSTKPQLEALTSLGRTPLAIAVRNADAPMANLLLEHGANPNSYAYAKCGKNCDLRGQLILHAIDVNSPEVVNLLLKHGASLKAYGDWGAGGVIHIALLRRKMIQQQSELSLVERQRELGKNTSIISALVNAGYPRVPLTKCNVDSQDPRYFKDNPKLIYDQDVLRILCESKGPDSD